MNKQHRHWLAFFLVLGLTLACVTPGLPAQAPINTLDPNSLSTVIAETAAALASQTAQAIPVANTQPPPPTETTAPTETVTTTPQVSTEGTSLSKQIDGSYIFSDYPGGYSVTVPAGWLALRLNESEFVNAWGLPEAANPQVQRALTQMQSSDPKVLRLYGLDTLSDHLRFNFVTNFGIIWDRGNSKTLQQNVDDVKRALPKSILQMNVTTATVGATSTQIPMGIIEGTAKLKGNSSQTLNIYEKQLMLHAKSGILIFTIATVLELKDAMTPGFNSMVDGIRMLP